MPVTARQLTNRVLRALRQSEIPAGEQTLTDEYQAMVWQLVNKARQEVEQAHKWRALRQEQSVTMPAGTSVAPIPGTNEHSLLMYDERGLPMVFDVTTPTNVFQMREVQLGRMRRLDRLDQGQEVEIPSFCTVDADNAQLILRVWPVPTTERQYNLDVYIPQGELEHTSPQALEMHILVPARPVELLALAYALEERGEELGMGGETAFRRANMALNEAISQDYQAQATMRGPGQYDLQVV